MGLKVGLGVGLGLGIPLLLALLFFTWWRRRRQRERNTKVVQEHQKDGHWDKAELSGEPMAKTRVAKEVEGEEVHEMPDSSLPVEMHDEERLAEMRNDMSPRER